MQHRLVEVFTQLVPAPALETSTLPAGDCPFSWSVEDRLADIHRRAAAGLLEPSRWHSVHRPLSVEQARKLLENRPPLDELVVCHGDTCAPNTMIRDDGTCFGHLDLGFLGTADRWADLAIATWSIEWNSDPDGTVTSCGRTAQAPTPTARATTDFFGISGRSYRASAGASGLRRARDR